MQKKFFFDRPNRKLQIGSMFRITRFSWILWILLGGGAPTAQAVTDPIPIPKQCAILSTGNPDDVIARDLASLATPQSEGQTEEILRRLAGTCDTRAVEAIIARLGVESLPVRLAAIDGLGRLGGPESADALVELLWSDPMPQIRLALIPAMIAFPSTKLRGLVRDLIAVNNTQETDTPEKAHVKGAAMLTLNQLTDTAHNRKALLAHFELENSGIPAIQPTVASSMKGLTKTRHGVRELTGILKMHNTPMVRRWAATWLGKLRVEEAREALMKTAVNDQSPEVRSAAEAALRELDQPPVP